jgi:hypothetical protein
MRLPRPTELPDVWGHPNNYGLLIGILKLYILILDQTDAPWLKFGASIGSNVIYVHRESSMISNLSAGIASSRQ